MSWLTASESYVCIKVIDWLDLAILILEKRDRDLMDFYISQFPKDVKLNQNHIDSYLETVGEDSPEFAAIGIRPCAKVREEVELFVEILKELDRWEN